MNEIDVKKFLEKLKQETKFSGLNQYPVEIVELGKEIGLTEEISVNIANYLVKSGKAEFKVIGNTMIQLK